MTKLHSPVHSPVPETKPLFWNSFGTKNETHDLLNRCWDDLQGALMMRLTPVATKQAAGVWAALTHKGHRRAVLLHVEGLSVLPNMFLRPLLLTS